MTAHQRQRQAKNRAAERKAIERAILRQLRMLWIPGDITLLSLQTQATLLGLEIARRQVSK
jgi:hypothetical protein